MRQPVFLMLTVILNYSRRFEGEQEHEDEDDQG
jgi:hypothetical protein